MKIGNKNRWILEKICRWIGFINLFIPKNKNKILIYNSTPTYQNNYAIFNYMIEQGYNKKYKIYYCMPNIKKHIGNVENIKAEYGLLSVVFHYLTAKYVFLDTGNIRIKPSKTQIVMNLWHGVPFKRIGFMSKTVELNLPKDLMNTFSKIVVSSKSLKKIYIQSFLLKEEQIFYGGQPRNDLLKKIINPFEILGINQKNYKKIIMWMTTYRISKDERLCHTSNKNWSETNLPLLINENICNQINKELEKKGILLIIKHHTTGKNAKAKIKETNNIKVLEEEEYLKKGLQLYEILGKCDALITDYSSVFTDYLLLNKPIAFITNDIEDYDKSNGFSLDNPLKYMVGKHLENLNGLIEFLENLIEENDKYELDRKKISRYFNEYHQENNCEYILEKMGI